MNRAEQIAEARVLRAESPDRWTLRALAARYSVSKQAVSMWLDPQTRGREARRGSVLGDWRQNQKKQAMREAAASKRSAGIERVSEVKSNDREMLRQRALIRPDTRDLTARFFGDPLPGRSALDQKKARDA